MMTVMTYLTLKQGSEPEWDRIMEQRLATAAYRSGWIRGEILMPLEGMNRRVIVGTWQRRSDWEAWHLDPIFQDTAAHLEALQYESSGPQWHEVVADVTSRRPLQSQGMTGKAASTLAAAAARARRAALARRARCTPTPE